MTTHHPPKTRVGRVISDKMEKTVVVAVERQYRHPLYKKILRATRQYLAHNENNQAKAGDTVKIMETRPLSRLKRWRVAEVITQGEVIQLPVEALEAPPPVKHAPPQAEPAAEAPSAETKSPTSEATEAQPSPEPPTTP